MSPFELWGSKNALKIAGIAFSSIFAVLLKTGRDPTFKKLRKWLKSDWHAAAAKSWQPTTS